MVEDDSLASSSTGLLTSIEVVVTFIENLRSAPRAARSIADEARYLRDVTEAFKTSLQSHALRLSSPQCEVAHRVLQSALRTVLALHRRLSCASRRALSSRTSWVLNVPETMAMCNSMRSYSQMLNSLRSGTDPALLSNIFANLQAPLDPDSEVPTSEPPPYESIDEGGPSGSLEAPAIALIKEWPFDECDIQGARIGPGRISIHENRTHHRVCLVVIPEGLESCQMHYWVTGYTCFTNISGRDVTIQNLHDGTTCPASEFSLFHTVFNKAITVSFRGGIFNKHKSSKEAADLRHTVSAYTRSSWVGNEDFKTGIPGTEAYITWARILREKEEAQKAAAQKEADEAKRGVLAQQNLCIVQ